MSFIQSDVLARVCNCDKTPTLPAVTFEIFILAGSAIALKILSKFQNNILKRFALVAIGVFIFEFFTSPMWVNSHLGPWAYVYQDVSWVLTVGWTTLILSVVVLVDQFFKKLNEWQKYGLYLLFLTFLVMIFESLVVNLGIRTYAPETLETINNLYIPLFNVPLQILYYVPAFCGLVIGFYKYWSFMLDQSAVVPVKKNNWLRNIFLSLLAVIFFELMVDPMVTNAKLPSWSYFYRDVSIIMSGVWIMVIWLATTVVDRLFIQLDLSKKFVLYLIAATFIMVPIEAWFIQNGFRVYGPSAVANFTGFHSFPFNVPIEVTFAIPLYLALVISLIRYWQIILDNKQ